MHHLQTVYILDLDTERVIVLIIGYLCIVPRVAQNIVILVKVDVVVTTSLCIGCGLGRGWKIR